MILQCPACNARYLVPDTSIGAHGRTVRCAQCKHSWHAKLEVSPEMLELDDMLGEIKPAPRIRPIPRGSNVPAPIPSISLAWKISTAAAAVAFLLIGVLAHKPAWLGFAPSTPFSIAHVKLTKPEDPKSSKHKIEFTITNHAEETLLIPDVRIVLLDSKGAELQDWYFGSGGTTLDAKRDIPFSTGDIAVRFSTGDRFVIDLGNKIELALRKPPA